MSSVEFIWQHLRSASNQCCYAQVGVHSFALLHLTGAQPTSLKPGSCEYHSLWITTLPRFAQFSDGASQSAQASRQSLRHGVATASHHDMMLLLSRSEHLEKTTASLRAYVNGEGAGRKPKPGLSLTAPHSAPANEDDYQLFRSQPPSRRGPMHAWSCRTRIRISQWLHADCSPEHNVPADFLMIRCSSCFARGPLMAPPIASGTTAMTLIMATPDIR